MEECVLVPSTCGAEEVGDIPGDGGVGAQSVTNFVVSGQSPSRGEDALSMQCKWPLRSIAAYGATRPA